MIQNSNNLYEGVRVRLDGNNFVHCTFRNCILEYGGTDGVGFTSNELFECRWAFVGPAENTINFLISLYSGLGSAGPQIVEELFQSIRRNATARNVQPASDVQPA